MNSKCEDIKKSIRDFEEKFIDKINEDNWRLGYHLMPPTGWMNDPNGLCMFKGKYHVFFQHNAMNPEGGKKSWGHYIGDNLLSWKYEGDAIVPDSPFDSHGAYSGCTFVKDDKMYIFYSANHKEPGNYDYIHEGRTNEVVLIESEDGINFSDKKILISWQDYPQGYTRHIRDPKVWEENGKYYMLLGARNIDDIGKCLLYSANDLYNWTFEHTIDTLTDMGYMWECPEYFSINGTKNNVQSEAYLLSVCPQGLIHQAFRFQNDFQSGYFLLSKPVAEGIKSCGSNEYDFHEWDKGFDFYAPQTLLDDKGRRILFGWVGIPGDPYFNPTKEKGWQHALTVPREITYVDGKIRALPVKELEELREEELEIEDGKSIFLENGMGDLYIEVPENENLTNGSSIRVAEDLVITYKDMIFSVDFEGYIGCGRTIRKEVISRISNVRILLDTSMVEIYINDGEQVFTTRFYPETTGFNLWVDCYKANKKLWKLRKMEVEY